MRRDVRGGRNLQALRVAISGYNNGRRLHGLPRAGAAGFGLEATAPIVERAFTRRRSFFT